MNQTAKNFNPKPSKLSPREQPSKLGEFLLTSQEVKLAEDDYNMSTFSVNDKLNDPKLNTQSPSLFPAEISSAIAEHLLSQTRPFKIPYKPVVVEEDPNDLRLQLDKILVQLKRKEALKQKAVPRHRTAALEQPATESPKPEVTVKLNKKIDVITRQDGDQGGSTMLWVNKKKITNTGSKIS